jgi:threonine synthase
MYGARVVVVDGNFDRALEVARAAADRFPLALVNSVNPFRIEGQTTAAFEICETLGDAPAVLALPVGNGGNITAYHLGFRRCADSRRATRVPRLLGAQAAGAAPLVHGHAVEQPETIATAIRIGRPATWEPALAAARDSGGRIVAVSDDAILEAWRTVARLEGVFCEPASAAGIAALRDQSNDAGFRAAGPCVCVLTGNGLKDPETALAQPYERTTIEPSAEALARVLDLD